MTAAVRLVADSDHSASVPTAHPALELVDLLLDAVCVVDADGKYVFVSAAFERIFGYAPHEVVGKTMIDMVFSEDRERTQQTAAEVMGGAFKLNFENRYIRKDGTIVHILWSARWSQPNGHRVGVARDLTERKRVESLQTAMQEISSAAHTAEDLSALFATTHRILNGLAPLARMVVVLAPSASDAPLEIAYDTDGTPPDSAAGLSAAALNALCNASMESVRTLVQSPDTATDAAHPFCVIPGGDLPRLITAPMKTPRGSWGAIVLQAASDKDWLLLDELPLVEFVAAQLATTVERTVMLTRLQHMAQFDQLTGVPNRELFNDRLRTAISRAQREGSCLALMFVDLDKFKRVNDLHGHAAGDALLVAAAQRLTASVRDCDTVARIGGDEFVVLLEGCPSADEAALVGQKIHIGFEAPFEFPGLSLRARVSIGVAMYPENGTDAVQLLGYADQAMYEVKRSKPAAEI